VLEFDEFGTYLEGAIGKQLRLGRRISDRSEWVVSALCRISGSMDDRGEHHLARGPWNSGMLAMLLKFVWSEKACKFNRSSSRIAYVKLT
jgi:hypothetical protein